MLLPPPSPPPHSHPLPLMLLFSSSSLFSSSPLLLLLHHYYHHHHHHHHHHLSFTSLLIHTQIPTYIYIYIYYSILCKLNTMLSSLNNPSSSSIISHDDQDSEEDPHHPHPHPHQFHPNPNFPVGAGHASTAATPSPRQLLVGCADLFGRGDFPAARRLSASLLSSASPLGDASDRVAHRFARALLRLLQQQQQQQQQSAQQSPQSPPPPSADDPQPHPHPYLSFNQITPFLRFAHLTANQAILDAAAAANAGQIRIHIVDFDTSHGLQWPPLLQALADLPEPPASVRITGTGPDPDVLLRTAIRLRAFARSLHLPFQFHPLLLPPSPSPIAAAAALNSPPPPFPGETLAVNCSFFLHKLFDNASDEQLVDFLRAIKAMNPAVVTVAEREAGTDAGPSGGGGGVFVQRFVEALDYYSAMFESMEATVPPGSRERLAVEGLLLGREIDAAVAAAAASSNLNLNSNLNSNNNNNNNSNNNNCARCWHRRFERWEAAMAAAGLAGRPLSGFALSQARLLLRLHYPSEGYRLEMVRGAFFLGWQSKPLFSVSSWH